MGATKRRRATAGRPHSESDAGLLELHAEAGGVLRLTLVTRDDLLARAVAALAGDGAAAPLVLAVGAWLEQAARSQTCTICDRHLAETGVGVLAVLLPERDDPTRAMVLGVCPTCCAEHGNDAGRIEAAVLAFLRRSWWPDLRLIAPPCDQAGRA